MQDVLFISVLVAAILYGPRLLNQDGDLGRHITIGRYILENHTIPLRDLFSHTMHGAPLVPHEWLSQVLLALAYNKMGLDGDVLLTSLVIALTFFLVYRETLKRGVSRLAALAIVLIAAGASSLHWLTRPHIFTFLLLAIWTFQLENLCCRQNRNIIIFPIIMLIWANTHGAFIAGFVILGIYVLEWIVEFRQNKNSTESGKQLLVVTVSSLIATLLNPSGWHLWRTSLGYIGNDYLVSHTVEYLSPDFHNSGTWPFLFMLLIGLAALSWGKHLHIRHGLLLAGWAALALYSARNIPLFAIVAAPILGELLQVQANKKVRLIQIEAGIERIEEQLRGFLWPAVAVACLVLLFTYQNSLNSSPQRNTFNPTLYPVLATDWLEKNPQQGNTFNYFTWGGYLLLRRWPEQRVFIDGQTDFYGEKLTREYEIAISTAPGWVNVLAKYGVEWAIIPVNSRLSRALAEIGWKELYEDQTTIILRKP